MIFEKTDKPKKFKIMKEAAKKVIRAAKFLAIPLLASGIIKAPSASAQSNMVPFNLNPHYSMRLEGISFPSLQEFCAFNRSLAADFSEQQKIGLCSDWLGVMAGGTGLGKIDKERASSGFSLLFNGYTVEILFEKFQKGEKVGMCGDLNVVMLNRMCEIFGLKLMAASVSMNAMWHVMGFIHGKDGNYLVNYGKAYLLDRDDDKATDQVFQLHERFTPYAYSLTKGGAFYSTPTEKLLFTLLGQEEGKRKEGMGFQLSADRYGNFGLSPYHQFKEIRLGLILLRSSTAATILVGPYADLNRDDGKKTGGITLPRMFGYIGFGATYRNPFPILVGCIVPYSYRMQLIRSRLEINPVQLDFATNLNNLNPKITSSLKLSYPIGRRNEIYLQGAATPVLSLEKFYSIDKVREAKQFKIGFSSKSTSFTISLTPESILSKLEADATQNINIGRVRLSATLESNFIDPYGRFFNGFNVRVAGQLH